MELYVIVLHVRNCFESKTSLAAKPLQFQTVAEMGHPYILKAFFNCHDHVIIACAKYFASSLLKVQYFVIKFKTVATRQKDKAISISEWIYITVTLQQSIHKEQK